MRRPVINLAVWDSQAGRDANDASGRKLLNDRIWCPMRPGADTSIIAETLSRDDGTLFAVHFGGPGGEYLPNMTKLVIGFSRRGMQFLEAQYNVPVRPMWSRIGHGP